MQSIAKIRTRGRPRSFDDKKVLEAAQATFARKGYAATTLDDLATAMGLNRPSIYTAFTDKETLYQRALTLYSETMGALFRDALESEQSVSKALRKLYSSALDAYVGDNGEVVGCMVACTAVAEAIDHDGIRRQSKSIFDTVDALVQKRIEWAKRDGDLPQNTDARALSRLAVAILHSLAIRSRSGTSRRVLDQIADDAVALIVPAAAPPSRKRRAR